MFVREFQLRPFYTAKGDFATIKRYLLWRGIAFSRTNLTMTSPLPSESLAQIEPVLGSIARLIATGLILSDKELKVLLLGVDVDPKSAVLDELREWVNLLIKIRDHPSEENCKNMVSILVQRGITHATAMMAVSTIAGRVPTLTLSHAPSLATQLSINVDRLDFGILPRGQPSVREFDVQGGPGQIIYEGDSMRVTPTTFGKNSTRIQVEVRPPASDLLWTSLRLVTLTGSLEVPVLAQWQTTSQLSPKMDDSALFSIDTGLIAIPPEDHVSIKAYKFGPEDKQAYSLADFVSNCLDEQWLAAEQFSLGTFEPWLRDELNRPDLAVKAKTIRERNADQIEGLRGFLLTTGILNATQKQQLYKWLAPILFVTPHLLEFRLQFHQPLLEQIVIIANRGKGTLAGKVRSTNDWLLVVPKEFSCQVCETYSIKVSIIRVFLARISAKVVNGILIIESNAGKAEVKIEVK